MVLVLTVATSSLVLDLAAADAIYSSRETCRETTLKLSVAK
jgi:hypothetical protein